MAPIGRARAPCHGRQPGLPVVSTSSVAIPAAAGLPHLIDQQLAQPLVLPMSRDGQVDELAHEREVAGGARTAHEPLPPFKPAAAAPRGVHVHGHHHRAGVERARQLLLGEAPLGCHARPRGRLEAQLQQLGRVDRARAAAHAHAPRHRIPRSYCNSSSSSSSGCGSTGAWASCPAGGARTEQYRRKKGKQNKKKEAPAGGAGRRKAGRGAASQPTAPVRHTDEDRQFFSKRRPSPAAARAPRTPRCREGGRCGGHGAPRQRRRALAPPVAREPAARACACLPTHLHLHLHRLRPRLRLPPGAPPPPTTPAGRPYARPMRRRSAREGARGARRGGRGRAPRGAACSEARSRAFPPARRPGACAPRPGHAQAPTPSAEIYRSVCLSVCSRGRGCRHAHLGGGGARRIANSCGAHTFICQIWI